MSDPDEILQRPEALHPDLLPYVREGACGLILVHPLLNTFYAEHLNALFNKSYLMRTEAVRSYIANRRWSALLGLYDKPFRLDILTKYRHSMTDEEYWSNLIRVWQRSENIFQDRQQWLARWNSRKRSKRSMYVMSAIERMKLSNLPETITIYRGSDNRESVSSGMSWTLDLEKARWFARRFIGQSAIREALMREINSPNGIILKSEGAFVGVATVRRDLVFAYLDQDSEIVVDPARIVISEINLL